MRSSPESGLVDSGLVAVVGVRLGVVLVDAAVFGCRLEVGAGVGSEVAHEPSADDRMLQMNSTFAPARPSSIAEFVICLKIGIMKVAPTPPATRRTLSKLVARLGKFLDDP